MASDFETKRGDIMKADLHTLKKELSRLTDTKYLKKELSRLTNEMKKFDVSRNLNSQARTQITHLEKRFKDLLQSFSDLQKQVDLNLEKIIHAVRRAPSGSPSKPKKTSRKAASAPSRTRKKSAPRPSASSVKKKSGKKTTRKS
jgi:predicted RNase H-like nuclease (RuvC/YqgF family)